MKEIPFQLLLLTTKQMQDILEGDIAEINEEEKAIDKSLEEKAIRKYKIN